MKYYKIDIPIAERLTDKDKNAIMKSYWLKFLKKINIFKTSKPKQLSKANSSFYENYNNGRYQEAIIASKNISEEEISSDSYLILNIIECYSWVTRENNVSSLEWFHYDNITNQYLNIFKNQKFDYQAGIAAGRRLDYLLNDFRDKSYKDQNEIKGLITSLYEIEEMKKYFNYHLEYHKGQIHLFNKEFEQALGCYENAFHDAERRGGLTQAFSIQKIFLVCRFLDRVDLMDAYTKKLILLGYIEDYLSEDFALRSMLFHTDEKILKIKFFS